MLGPVERSVLSWVILVSLDRFGWQSQHPDVATHTADLIRSPAFPGTRRKPALTSKILRELKPFGVVIPQDKSPKAAVLWRIRSYWQALCCNFILDTRRYDAVWAWNPQDLVSEQYLQHSNHVTPMFQLSTACWNMSRMARAYLTVKRKCFQHDLGLTGKSSMHIFVKSLRIHMALWHHNYGKLPWGKAGGLLGSCGNSLAQCWSWRTCMLKSWNV